MAGKKHHSDRIKMEAAALFASGLGVVEVAEALGVPSRTVYKWHVDPAVKAEIEHFLSQRRRAIAAQIQALAPSALDVIREILTTQLDPKDIRPSHKLRAALGILATSNQNDAIALAEKMDRVTRLSEQIDNIADA